MSRDARAAGLSALLAALVWAFSPAVTGHAEPWDADSPYYYVALVAAGFISGLAIPARKLAHYGGAIAGQVAYMFIFLKVGSLVVLGIVVLFVYSLLSLAGAAAGMRLRRPMTAKENPD